MGCPGEGGGGGRTFASVYRTNGRYKCFPQEVYKPPPPPLVSSPCQTQNQGKNNKINKVEKQKGESKNQSAEGTMAIYIIRSASSFPFPSSSAYGKWSRIEKKKKKMLQKKKYIRQGKKKWYNGEDKTNKNNSKCPTISFSIKFAGYGIDIARHPPTQLRAPAPCAKFCQGLQRKKKERRNKKEKWRPAV